MKKYEKPEIEELEISQTEAIDWGSDITGGGSGRIN